MSIRDELNKKFGISDIEPIEGFSVIKWLRRVRDESHTLLVSDPEAYQRALEEASTSMYAMVGKQGEDAKQYKCA